MNILLLAGGKSERMNGQEKALQLYNGKPMIEHLLEKLVNKNHKKLIISCNRLDEYYKNYSEALVNDKCYSDIKPFSGPLLGVLSALDQYPCRQLLVLPCDTPNISAELLERLISSHSLSKQKISCLSISGRVQPLHCIIDASLRDSLFNYLALGNRKVQAWISSHKPQLIDCGNKREELQNINYLSQLV